MNIVTLIMYIVYCSAAVNTDMNGRVKGRYLFNITLPGLVIFAEWQLELNLINIGMVY